MKSIRYKVTSDTYTFDSPSANDEISPLIIVEMSVPYQTQDSEVKRLLEELYPSFQKLRQKFSQKDKQFLAPPTHDEYMLWRDKIGILIPLVQKEMGLYAKRYKFRYMRSRWGSCAPHSLNISLNSALATLPEECSHYVLVHELSHFIHPDHSPQFWQHVETYFPDYRRVRGILKKYTLN